ncbi:MAG: UvrD-helicase domain-containing protein [Spirochaetales bacterium]|nr:UvrD-helicase domain-containing protein [Spirochaetales bacterium]
MHYIDALNDKQKEAVFHLGPPLLILAGAGSGKTRVITTKIAWLIQEKGYDPRSILAVTFTNKAADEMKTRVLSMVDGAENVMIKTFHSFGAWLMRRNSHLLGLPPRFSIYDDDDMVALLKTVLKTVVKEKITAQNLRWIASSISRAKDKCLTPDDDLSAIDFDKSFHIKYRAYQSRIEEMGCADFGDLIMRPVRFLRENPQVKKRLQQRFTVILVDEFQDSNRAQFELLKEFYYEDNYLCVVGDEDQSIYSFRGAEVQNIVEFPKIFPGTKVIMLEQNYRSTGNILKLATKVVEHNEYRLGKNLWTKNKNGDLPVLYQASDQDEEALFCAHLLKDGNFNGTAILYRNNYQSRAFESLFIRLRIPYRIVGTLRFYEREEIKDILAYLKFLVNMKDEVAFTRIINKPPRGIGGKNQEKIKTSPGNDYLEKSKNILPELSKKIKDNLVYFINVIEESLRIIESHEPGEVVQQLIFRSGLYDHYKEKDKNDNTMKLQNLEEFVNATASYPGGMEGLALFLEATLLDSSNENPYVSEEKVTLITVHNTKGLEFDRVILTGLEDGLFPHLSHSDFRDDNDIEEERRLFYVGVTRARKELYFTCCIKRLVFGQYISQYLSRFLSEIPRDCLQPFHSIKAESGQYFSRGDRVSHPEYGTGTIDRRWDNDDEEMVIVRFDSGRYLQFITGYSKLEKLQHS